MATIKVCDRCNREIHIAGKKIVQPESTRPQDLCDACYQSFMDWWANKLRVSQDAHILPGWTCNKCGVFNGEAKETRLNCRSCGATYDGA